MRHTLNQLSDAGAGHAFHIDGIGRDTRLGEVGEQKIIKPDKGNVLRHTQSHVVEKADEVVCRGIAVAHKGGGQFVWQFDLILAAVIAI